MGSVDSRTFYISYTTVMAKFFLEVEKHLGEPFVKIIMASASGGKVTDQDIKRFAQLLGYCSDQNSHILKRIDE